MKFYRIIAVALSFVSMSVQAQNGSSKGKLFIMGGGDRPLAMMKALVSVSEMKVSDYVIVLPMSSEYPDTAYNYFKADLEPVCKNVIINFNFTRTQLTNKNWLDSLKKARLIFITGGDQDRFMKAVMHTPVYEAIQTAYRNGATIAGTSAGAAVMSEHMITGNELTDTVYRSTFRRIKDKNIEI